MAGSTRGAIDVGRALSTATTSIASCAIAPATGGNQPLAATSMPMRLNAMPPIALCSAIDRIRPSIYIKGQDYQNPEGDITGKISLERDAVEAHGGHIHFTDEVTFSSTELINRPLNVFEQHIREHRDSLRQAGGLREGTGLIDRVRA